MRRIRNANRLSSTAVACALRAATNPLRLLTVASYWAEFDEPTQLLDDPLDTFAQDARDLITLCERDAIPYNPGIEPAFPVWLLRAFYPANP